MSDNPIANAAKELRQKQTEAERILWFKLRDQQLMGLKFRRQEPIGSYIVDFVSFEQKVVIEIDGNYHRETEIKRNDKQRTEWLNNEGFRVLRFWDDEVLKELPIVMNKIKVLLGK